MFTKASRSAAVTIASLLTMAVSAAIWAQATVPAASGPSPESAPATNASATATAPATTPAVSSTATLRAGVSKTARMAFHFQAATIDEILSEMSQRFGFIVVQAAAIGQRVTINVPNPVDADEAIRLVNSALFSIQYATVESRTGEGENAKTVLRVVSVLEAKKSQIPVREGADPEKIALDDTVITQIIPLKNLDAARTRSDLAPMISSDADVSSNPAANVIIITDTSAKIRRLVEIIQKLDNQRTIKTVTELRQLTNSDATQAATLLNNMFNPTNTGQSTSAGGGGAAMPGMGGATGAAPGAGGRGGRGGMGGGGGTGSGLAAVQGRLYAAPDVRTNTVLVTGPAEQVVQAVEMLAKIEAIPIDVLNNSVFFIKHLKNANCATISPVLNQIFGTGGNTANLGTNNRSTTTTGLTFTSSTNRTTGTGGTGGRTTGTGGTGGTTGRGGDVDDSISGGEAGGMGGGTTGGRAAGGGGMGGGGGAGGGMGGRGNTGNTNRAGTGVTGTRGTTNTAASALSGAAYFVPNADTNSILVTTDKTFEERVRGIIDELDRPVPQVLIKALVCEVTHTNTDDVGFEFGVNNDLRTGTDINGNALTLGLLGGSNFGIAESGGGFKIGLVESQIQATLRALANQNKIEVLSRPYILTQDNQEAYITIGQQVPYVSNSQITNTGQTINSVAYAQVGITLDVLPHVNPDGLVTMTIAPQVSQLGNTGIPISAGITAPTFITRQAYANVAIKNGETIIIGGLMQDQNQQAIQKIPILGDIPYLGMLFKRTTNEKIKTELLIFITPHVAMTPEILQKMTDEDTQTLKLVPNAVQPGTWEQQMRGMEAGATTTQPQREIRIERGNLTPQP